MGIVPVNLINAASGAGPALAESKPGSVSFAQVVEHLLADANAQQVQADHAVQMLAAGKTDNIHDVMLAVAKADLSLHTVLEIRNRITEAYQEIMRMQV